MRIIPVLDVKDGQVVRGIAGRRDEYRPIQSQLTSSTDPLEVAHSIRDAFALSEFYLADLDAILGKKASLALFERLIANDFQVMIDCGIRSTEEAKPLIECGAQIVAGLETMPDVSVLDDLCSRWGSDVIFSLDLKNGRPLAWSDKVSEVINLVTKVGVERMLILDLATVGTHAGPSTLNQCRQLKVSHPALRLLTGGGIRNEEDLRAVEESGVESVLVASALHDGSLDSLRKS